MDKVPKEYIAYLKKQSAQFKNGSASSEKEETQTDNTGFLENGNKLSKTPLSEHPKSSPIEKKTADLEGPLSSPSDHVSSFDEEEPENISEELTEIGRENAALTLKFQQSENKFLYSFLLSF